MTAVDLAILFVPTGREMAEAPSVIDAARETLTRLGARPLLARLDRSVPTTRSEVEAVPKAPVRKSGDVAVNG